MSDDPYLFADPGVAVKSDDDQRGENDARSVMATEGGRRFIWSIIMVGRIFEPGIMSDYGQGRRDVSLEVRRELKRLAPDLFAIMEKENAE